MSVVLFDCALIGVSAFGDFVLEAGVVADVCGMCGVVLSVVGVESFGLFAFVDGGGAVIVMSGAGGFFVGGVFPGCLFGF